MGVGTFSVAAATAVVGYDLAQNTVWQQESRPRVLTGFGLKGSTAGADSKVSIFIDTVKVGEFTNIDVGVPNINDVFPMNNLVPSGAQIHIYVDDAPTTNPLNGVLVYQ